VKEEFVTQPSGHRETLLCANIYITLANIHYTAAV